MRRLRSWLRHPDVVRQGLGGESKTFGPHPGSTRNGTNQEREVAKAPITASLPSIDDLRSLFTYDPLTGILRWRVSPRARRRAGDVAGSLNIVTGYRRIRIKGFRRRFQAHRVAWALFYGEWPSMSLDHINGVRDDNRIVNLRLATAGQNKANSVPQSKYGVKGIFRERNGRWGAQIWRDGALRRLGVFATMAEAAAAFAVAHRRQHGEFSRTDALTDHLSAHYDDLGNENVLRSRGGGLW